MEITWLGHSSFRLRSGNTTLLTDPFPQSYGFTMPTSLTEAKVVTQSNTHPNHAYMSEVRGTPTILDGPGEYEANGLYIKGIRTALAQPPEEGEQGSQWNTIFSVEIEGMVVCHLGDIGTPLPSRQIEELSSPQILFVPVGGRCTITPAEAADIVNVIAPRIVIPMHYSIPGAKVDLDGLAPFLKELGVKAPDAQTRLSVTRSNLPDELQVVILQAASSS